MSFIGVDNGAMPSQTVESNPDFFSVVVPFTGRLERMA